MSRIAVVLCCAAFLSLPALAADPKGGPPAGGMDISKMGPAIRKPTNEKQTKKDIEAFFKKDAEMMEKKDMEGMLSMIDFPIYMVTDDSKGVTMARVSSKDEYIAEMKDFYENMPADMKMTHKRDIVVLSDSLASVNDNFTMTMGKTKVSGRNHTLLVKVGDQWKVKTMTEAGWGDMAGQAAHPAGHGKPETPPAAPH